MTALDRVARSRPPALLRKPLVSALVSCFRGETFLPGFLENCSAQTIASETEIVLVHNEPSAAEVRIVEQFSARNPDLIKHVITERESIGRSTNRALSLARGEYVCIWNVDDLRTINSLELMAATLDETPLADFTYGDFTVVDQWMATHGTEVSPPSFERRAFVRSMLLGPFYMWRREAAADLGGWDEQFSVGADFDFAIRLALATDGVKTDGLLGYYLNQGVGLSTSASGAQAVEATAIMLRYGILDKVVPRHLRAAREYQLDSILQDGDWVDMSELSVARNRYSTSRMKFGVAVARSVRDSAVVAAVRARNAIFR